MAIKGGGYGKCGPNLWLKCKLLSMELDADSAECEGINNMLKYIGRKSPKITLELLDSRVRLKKVRAEAGCFGKDSGYNVNSTAIVPAEPERGPKRRVNIFKTHAETVPCVA